MASTTTSTANNTPASRPAKGETVTGEVAVRKGFLKDRKGGSLYGDEESREGGGGSTRKAKKVDRDFERLVEEADPDMGKIQVCIDKVEVFRVQHIFLHSSSMATAWQNNRTKSFGGVESFAARRLNFYFASLTATSNIVCLPIDAGFSSQKMKAFD